MKKLSFLLTALMLMGLAGGEAKAASGLINLNFDFGDYPYSNGAAIDDEDQTWNVIDDNSGGVRFDNLLYSDIIETHSSVSVTLNCGGYESSESAISGVDNPFMSSYLVTGGDTGTIDFSGLTPGQYEIYVYSQKKAGDMVPSHLQISATTFVGSSYDFTINNTNDATSLIEGTNWIKKTVVVDHTGNINMVLSANSSLNGIQIQAVPEPNSIVLLGVGGVLIYGMMTRKNNFSA